MPKSLLEQLPEIVATGRKQAEKILEGIESRQRVSLQTREVVLPAKDSATCDWITQQTRATQREVFAPGPASLWPSAQPLLGAAAPEPAWANRLIYGDNLLAMAALLAGDEQTPSLRGKVDLIYIDPPFDSKADYRTKVTLPAIAGGSSALELEQKPTVIEQFAYSDTWSDGTASYLAMITPRLILMRELLADTGSIYVHLDWHVGHYVKLVMDEVFGKDQFINQLIWKRGHAHSDSKQGSAHFGRLHDTIFLYSKSQQYFFTHQFTPYTQEYQDTYYKNIEPETGRRYWLDNLQGPGGAAKGNPYYEVMGVSRYWRYSKEKMRQLIDAGRIVQTKPGTVPKYKRYLDD